MGANARRFRRRKRARMASIFATDMNPRYGHGNAVDFNDLILLTLRLFTEHPEALEGMPSQNRYVMVDEYQDTNAAQFNLVHAANQEHAATFVFVGDDDQSIYGWRGPKSPTCLTWEKHFHEVN